jgi:putative sterol carrier protein
MKNNDKKVEVLPAVLPSSDIEIAKDLDTDYEYTRDNLKEIIEKGSEALDGILELAKESEHPRAYEVVGQIIKNVADVNRQLIDLQKDIKGLKRTESGPKNVTNALFVGSTHDLLKLIKGKLNPNISNSEE